ncbi:MULTISPECIES: anthrone oxygenase family protein [unclassified Mycolicibacterium]|uniref:anthrone oxygenase family protein n=2 Tax=Mycolicibacterium TaxID=1866885 RepID=UPI001EE48C17|nr:MULTISPECIES: anthrone oxygenase family protein [unclassified Mycolicibacterium]
MNLKLPQPLGTTALIVAVLTSGLLAGVYYAYAISVMPALGAFDDRTFIDVMNKINVVIVNPPFMLTFLGSIGFTALAGACYLKPGARPVLVWIGIALALNIASLVITSAINVPLNNNLAAATASTAPADLAALRAHFESSWVRWNLIRALANTAATSVLAWALTRTPSD